MHALDHVVIGLYFAATLLVGLRMAGRSTSGDDYFLGARDLPAWAVMLSIVATETSALTVVSLPGIGARGDLSFLQLAFGYLAGRMAVAWWLLPGYFQGRQQTAYERLQTRFGPLARQGLAVVFLGTRLLADGVRIFAGAIPLALLTGWDLAASILAVGGVTLLYTFVGGLRAVVWAAALQLLVYLAGGVAALWVATALAGGPATAWAAAAQAGKLVVLDTRLAFDVPYTLAGGLIGGAMMSAASHGSDHIIVQRLLATRSLGEARWALVGSGLLVILQFALFLGAGVAIWAAGLAPLGLAGDQVFSRFVIEQLPAGLAGLVVAAILAAAMSTISSSISALASSMTHDLYAAWSGRRDPGHLLRVGRLFSLMWGVALIGAALGFLALGPQRDTPVVVLALSVASVTYGALLGALLLAASRLPLAAGEVVAGVALGLVAMLGIVFAGRLQAVLPWLAPWAGLAFPWYVPLGTALTLLATLALHGVRRAWRRRQAA